MIYRFLRRQHVLLVGLAAVFGVSALGGDCGKKKSAAADATTTSSDAGATCAEYCNCMASKCTTASFSPTCLEACNGLTSEARTIARWDLACRAAACYGCR